jgi:hypothetical protein
LEFGFVYISEKCEAERAASLGSRIGADLAGDTGSELKGLIEDEWIVEQAQGLERRRGLRASGGHDRWVGAVEGTEEWLTMRADNVAVDGAAECCRAFGKWFVDGDVAFNVVESAVAGPANSLVQRTADEEDRVAQRFGIEAVTVRTPQE